MSQSFRSKNHATNEIGQRPYAQIALYCSSTSWGGLEMMVLRLGRWMRQRGWTIAIYCQPNTPIELEAKSAGFHIHHVVRPTSIFDLKQALWLRKTMQAHGTEAVFAHLNHDISVLSWVRKLSSGRIRLLYLQTMGLGVNKRDFFHTRRYRQIDAWLSPLESLRQELKRRTHMPQDRCYVVRQGVELAVGGSDLSQAEARALLALKDDVQYVGVLGRLDPAKGQSTVLQALHLLRDSHPKLHAVFMGAPSVLHDNSYVADLKSEILALGLESRVNLLEFRQDPSAFFRAIDLFAMATRSETYGYVTLEAMLSKCAIIGTRSGGTPELLEDGARGLLFEPDNAQSCAEAIRKSLPEPNEPASVGAQRKRKLEQIALEVDAQFSSAQQCEQIERILSSLQVKQTLKA